MTSPFQIQQQMRFLAAGADAAQSNGRNSASNCMACYVHFVLGLQELWGFLPRKCLDSGCPENKAMTSLCNVLQLSQRWQTRMQSSASHGVASSVTHTSLHAVVQFSIVQHEFRAPHTLVPASCRMFYIELVGAVGGIGAGNQI